MKTIVRILAPVTLAFAAMSANAAIFPSSFDLAQPGWQTISSAQAGSQPLLIVPNQGPAMTNPLARRDMAVPTSAKVRREASGQDWWQNNYVS